MHYFFQVYLLIVVATLGCTSTPITLEVKEEVMQAVYNEIKAPYKYGIVISQPDSSKMVDSPTVFRRNGKWYMTYIVFDGKGYETWIAESDNLLNWMDHKKIMSHTEEFWDATQKAGYPALVDPMWGGSYEINKFDNNFWFSYLGGNAEGYEAGQLGVGIASTSSISQITELERRPAPVLSPTDNDARWYDNYTIFKSSIVEDPDKKTGYPYLMYYNAAGDTLGSNGQRFESIAMAGSHDMLQWKRIGKKPVISKGRGIVGDAQVVQMDDLYVMFYFGHNWVDGDKAFDRFACSYDLQNWTEWTGPNLIEPSEPYDDTYAHKPWVIKWENVVYHFYNAVGTQGRVIALSTSVDLRPLSD